jgi:hypothetical protein
MPQDPGVPTHVALVDHSVSPRNVVASGHGPDEPDALFELWTALTGREEAADGLALVVSAYVRRTGKSPGDSE